MSHRVLKPIARPLLAVAAFSLLAACGGGGGSSGGSGVTPIIPTPTPTPTPSLTATNASGKVVDDSSNAPLAGVRVVLKPWVANATPLPIPQAATAADGSFMLSNAPNGHYLLVIGSDSPSDTARATVHDNVTLTGGNQVLVAPTLLPIPGFTPPPSETGGNYRLASINATTELPCFTRFNTDRTTAGQPQVPLDEWSTENLRGATVYFYSPQFSGKAYDLTPLWAGNGSGGTSCSTFVDMMFPPNPQAWANDARVGWFGGIYTIDPRSNKAFMTSPFDPRTYTDPTWPNWP